MRALYLVLGMSLFSLASSAPAQPGAPDPAALIQSERDAMRPLSWMDGRWEGPGWARTAQGRHDILQTERIGPMLGGSIKVVEGKSFETNGRPAAFNAFGVISFDPAGRNYSLHSYAQGRAGDFPMKLTADGYVWSIPAGPVTIRYTARLHDGIWREIGEVVRADGGSVQIFEMNLHRVGDSDWPLAGEAASPHGR